MKKVARSDAGLLMANATADNLSQLKSAVDASV
jgi:hypothetical protein